MTMEEQIKKLEDERVDKELKKVLTAEMIKEWGKDPKVQNAVRLDRWRFA